MYKLSMRAAAAVGTAALLVASLTAASIPDDGEDTGRESLENYLKKHPQIEVLDPAVYDSPTAIVVGEFGEVLDVVGDAPNTVSRDSAPNADLV
ncbi:MAG: hypothetical protein ACYC2K_17395, partial [Gemmatimonadales bacterium]